VRIALVTCERPIERDDDLDYLVPALKLGGAEIDVVGWSAPEVDWSSYDLTMLSSTWDYHERLGDFRAWLRRIDGLTRLRNPRGLIEWNLDKRYLDELAAAGLPTIPTVWSEPGDDAGARVAELAWEEIVIKPVVDLGARNLVRVGADLVPVMLDRFEVPTMLQPYLPSVAEEGELSLVYIEGGLSHALRKLPRRGDFRVQPQYGGTHERIDAPADAIELGARALASIPSTALYARADLVWDEEGELALIELELIEPALYLDVEPASAKRLAAALLAAAA
jgi:glutathione synthase/RimK-type ligase-like ATP-grasp enzyme